MKTIIPYNDALVRGYLETSEYMKVPYTVIPGVCETQDTEYTKPQTILQIAHERYAFARVLNPSFPINKIGSLVDVYSILCSLGCGESFDVSTHTVYDPKDYWIDRAIDFLNELRTTKVRGGSLRIECTGVEVLQVARLTEILLEIGKKVSNLVEFSKINNEKSLKGFYSWFFWDSKKIAKRRMFGTTFAFRTSALWKQIASEKQ